MAVYKSTRCYPFLNSIDPRVTQTIGSTETPVQYLKCKVDTSNKKVTGYKIRILDGANNVIFDPTYISPISELQNMEEIYQSNGNNSGLNGTYLYIPFFQSDAFKKTNSVNSLYYIPRYSVDHIVMDQGLCDDYDLSITISGANDIEYKVDNEYMWTKDSNSTDVYYNQGEGTVVLDGEVVLEGDIVLFATSEEPYSGFDIGLGLYKVEKVKEGLTWYTVFKKMDITIDSDTIINITKGKTFHNTNWERKSSVSDYYQFYDSTVFYKYYNSDGLSTSIRGLEVGGALYKWEITLYQGDGIPSNGLYQYMDYSNLDNADYDMTASSGTILGSNSSRIQIASGEPFIGGAVNPGTVLPGLNQGVLVLQGKYMGLGSSSSSGIFNEKRIYVQTYDTSYGHVYPIEGDLDAGKVNYYDRVQFFKRTNDPEAIKETDTVKYGCGYNISFYMYNSDDYTKRLTLDQFTNSTIAPINKRKYGIRVTDLPLSLQGDIKAGDKILLTGQITESGGYTSPCQNGVYELYEINNTGLTDFFFLKRAASYDTWASYLGQVIFCPAFYETVNASPSVTNKESLAAAGSYELWDPDNVMSGSSDLYFTSEIPILIFGNKLNSNYTYDLMTTASISDGDPANAKIDGIMPQEGFLVITNTIGDLEVYKVINSGGNLRYSEVTDANLIPSVTDYYYVSQGKNYGKRIFKGLGGAANWDLYTAHILKNTTEYTYITPFINVKRDMRLKLLQEKTVTISGKITSWIQIENVNNLLYCIYHPVLSQPLVSEKKSDTNTPWRYEIRTFFKTSDENPFYSYEMPYLILSKNNTVYSSLLRDPDEEYWVTEVGEGTFPFKVKTDLTTDPSIYQNFVFNSFKDADVVYGRSVKFSANYVQFDGLSWESYRWTLYNKDGDLLQDTGKKYDKSIAVIFYGLSDDSSGAKSTYYAVLEVEDEKQNKIIYIIKFFVEAAKKVNTNLDFRATVDCDIHAVKLDFSQYKFLKPSFRDAVDNVDNSILDKYGTEGGVAFNSNTGATIYNSTDAPIDYTYGSLIDTSDGVDFNELTRVGTYGLPYYTTFGLKEQNHAIDNSGGLFIETQEGDYDDNGQFYFETCMCLDPDFCGPMVSWSVERQYSDSNEYPYLMSNGTEFSKTGFINFTLRSADNFIFTGASVPTPTENYIANEHRNEIILDISINNGVKSKSHSCSKITLFDIVSSSNSYYYLQPIEYNTPAVKTGEYEFLEYDLSYYPSPLANEKKELYIKKDKNGNFFAGGADYYFTNLCMGSSSLTSFDVFSYWDENRPHLDEAESNSRILNNTQLQFVSGLRNDDHYVTRTGSLLWPTAEQEETLYWKESRDIEESPILWSDVLATDSHVVQMGALKRHYGIENYSYHLICKINDIQGLYDQIDNNASALNIKEASGGEGISVLTLSSDGNSYGTIVIIKESN